MRDINKMIKNLEDRVNWLNEELVQDHEAVKIAASRSAGMIDYTDCVESALKQLSETKHKIAELTLQIKVLEVALDD